MYKLIVPFDEVEENILNHVDDLDSWLGVSIEHLLSHYIDALERSGRQELEIGLLYDAADDFVSRRIIFDSFEHVGDIESIKDVICEVFEYIDIGLARTLSRKPVTHKWVVNEVIGGVGLILELKEANSCQHKII